MDEIKKKVSEGHAVQIWQEQDGFETITLEVHHGGFLLGIRGENLDLPENNSDLVSTVSWVTPSMLDSMKGTMKKYQHLVDPAQNDFYQK